MHDQVRSCPPSPPPCASLVRRGGPPASFPPLRRTSFVAEEPALHARASRPSSRTDWTRLVPPPVLTGHVFRARPALHARAIASVMQRMTLANARGHARARVAVHGGGCGLGEAVGRGAGARGRAPHATRTNWTRLVLPPVLTGRVSSQVELPMQPFLPPPPSRAEREARARAARPARA
jgi:hypothetical protein